MFIYLVVFFYRSCSVHRCVEFTRTTAPAASAEVVTREGTIRMGKLVKAWTRGRAQEEVTEGGATAVPHTTWLSHADSRSSADSWAHRRPKRMIRRRHLHTYGHMIMTSLCGRISSAKEDEPHDGRSERERVGIGQGG